VESLFRVSSICSASKGICEDHAPPTNLRFILLNISQQRDLHLNPTQPKALFLIYRSVAELTRKMLKRSLAFSLVWFNSGKVVLQSSPHKVQWPCTPGTMTSNRPVSDRHRYKCSLLLTRLPIRSPHTSWCHYPINLPFSPKYQHQQ